jgi:hypothetical protein
MAASLTACLILASALLSCFATAVAAANLVFDWLGKRPHPAAWIPALCQYTGTFCAVIGFTFRSVELAAVAGLLLALHLLLSSSKENVLSQTAETVVLASAIFSLGSLAIVRGFPLF